MSYRLAHARASRTAAARNDRHIVAILAAVKLPDLREADPVPGCERFYRRDLNSRRWLRVVVDFNDAPALVVTAFVQDNAPESTS